MFSFGGLGNRGILPWLANRRWSRLREVIRSGYADTRGLFLRDKFLQLPTFCKHSVRLRHATGPLISLLSSGIAVWACDADDATRSAGG